SVFFLYHALAPHRLLSFPTRRSSDLFIVDPFGLVNPIGSLWSGTMPRRRRRRHGSQRAERFAKPNCAKNPGRSSSPARVRILRRSEEHTSELQSRGHLVCRLLLEKKN